MKNSQELKLIEGTFSLEEAKEILLNMFSSKISFHNSKNWSSLERFGKEDEIAKKRIPSLQREMRRLQKILAGKNVQKKRFTVIANVTISVIK